MTSPRPHRSGHFEVGGGCPHCAAVLEAGDRVVSCPRCGISQHESCWDLHDGCGSYHCLRGDRFDPRGAAPDLVITPEDLARAPAEPVAGARAARRAPPPPAEPAAPERTSRLATWSLGRGIAGVLLLGCPGVVASVLGGVALARIGSSRGRLGGTGMAVAGMVLGVLSAVGWLVAGAIWLDERTDRFERDFPREVRLDGLPSPIEEALRQNVKIEGSRGGKGFLPVRSRWIGSGVVLSIGGGRTVIVTNRHVAVGGDGKGAPKGEPALRVRFIDGRAVDAEVRWLAPGGVDLALLSCPAAGEGVRSASLGGEAALRVGDPLFAVGSPQGFGWTFTKGIVSGFTSRDEGGRSVEVIQTQTPISPGSSGGGLYDEEGRLVGINTWTISGEGSEGLHFAISVGALRDLLRETGEKIE